MASQETEVFTSLSAARSLLEQKGQRPLLLLEESALEDFTGGSSSLSSLSSLSSQVLPVLLLVPFSV